MKLAYGKLIPLTSYIWQYLATKRNGFAAMRICLCRVNREFLHACHLLLDSGRRQAQLGFANWENRKKMRVSRAETSQLVQMLRQKLAVLRSVKQAAQSVDAVAVARALPPRAPVDEEQG